MDSVYADLGEDSELRLFKQRVWRKRYGIFQFEPDQIFRLVGVFLAAIIATHLQGPIDWWWTEKRVGFSKRNLVSKEEVLLLVIPMVLAQNDPEVLRIRHLNTPRIQASVGPPVA